MNNPAGSRNRPAFPAVCAICFMLMLPAIHAAEAPRSEAAAQQRLQEVSQAISSIEQWLQETRRRRSAEEAALAELDQQLVTIQTSILQNQSRLQQLQSEQQQLDTDIAALLRESEEQREQLANALQATYLAGSDSQLKLLLNQQDPAQAQRMLVYFEAFNQERLEQIKLWLDTMAGLEQARTALTETRQALTITSNTLEEQQVSLQQNQTERQALIASLTSQMGTRSSELSSLQEDRAGLQALIEQINQVLIDIPETEDLMPFTQSRGNMPWPVTGAVLASYGQSFSNGLRRQGIIIAADSGTAVRAIHPGRVVFSDWLRGSGNLLVVDHGNAYISLYAHNQQLIKRSGDWVNRGEAVALSGPDGGSGQPGVYFEIRRNSETLNPVEWLESRN